MLKICNIHVFYKEYLLTKSTGYGGDLAYEFVNYNRVLPSTCYAKDRYVFLLHPA